MLHTGNHRQSIQMCLVSLCNDDSKSSLPVSETSITSVVLESVSPVFN